MRWLESITDSVDMIFFFYNFIYFWLHWTFVAVQGLSLVVVLRLLTVVASLVAELRLNSCDTQS